MSEYRKGQRVHIEFEGEVVELLNDKKNPTLRIKAEPADWYIFVGEQQGVTVTVLSERPDEPIGLGAIVQASLTDKGKSWLFVRVYPDEAKGLGYKWRVVDPDAVLGNSFFNWDRLIDPVIKAEGWTP